MKNRSSKIFFWSILILVILSIVLVYFIYYFQNQDHSDDNQTKDSREQNDADPKQADSIKENPEISIPDIYDLKVPFIAQAPYAIWDELHNEACEEASILLVHYYYQKINPTKAQFDKDIRTLVDYQIKKYTKHKDLTAEETADLAREYLKYQDVEVIYDFSWKDVKKAIAQDHPVIIPAAGRLLKNLYFTPPGPIYHMLVIRGYTPDEIITNDVGTRRGESYGYSYTILDQAIHDWTGNPATISSGRRVMLVIKD